MNNYEQLSLNKSKSLHVNKYQSNSSNPQQKFSIPKPQSHIQQMIFQKYNFSHRLKNNSRQIKNKNPNFNKSKLIPSSNVIVTSQFPKIQHPNPIIHNNQLFDNAKIKTKQKQNSIETYNYALLIQTPPRKITDYKQCIKRIQMNTTYRGFNFSKNKLYNKNKLISNQKFTTQKDQGINKSCLKIAERKRIINYIAEKSQAKKMQESLIKARNQKKKLIYELSALKYGKSISPFKAKREVIFPQTQTSQNEKKISFRIADAKQHLIEPWQIE